MKRFVVLIIVIAANFLHSCENENNFIDENIDNKNSSFQYEATVIGGLDCGETYNIELRRTHDSSSIENGIYYADHLDSIYKIDGLEILLNCREPKDDEIYPCTTMGPTYPHVIIIDCKLNEDD